MKKPVQKRSADSLERVIEAAEEILLSQSAEEFTVSQIVEASGVSVGAIYGRFTDKEGVFLELVSRFMRRTLGEFEKIDKHAWAQKSLADFLDSVVEINADIYFSHRGVLRSILMRTQLARDPVMLEAREKYNRKVGRMLREMFLAHSDEINHPDPEEATSVAIEAMTAMLREGVVFANRNRIDTRTIRRTQSLLKCYLQLETV